MEDGTASSSLRMMNESSHSGQSPTTCHKIHQSDQGSIAPGHPIPGTDLGSSGVFRSKNLQSEDVEADGDHPAITQSTSYVEPSHVGVPLLDPARMSPQEAGAPSAAQSYSQSDQDEVLSEVSPVSRRSFTPHEPASADHGEEEQALSDSREPGDSFAAASIQDQPPVATSAVACENETQTSPADAIGKDRTTSNTPWRPPFLRRPVILLAMVLFTLLLLALQLLLAYSNHIHGICSASSSYRYVWIYGPSAIFTLASIAWYQVEYDAKMMQPWIEMAEGHASVDRSLLLDYINALEPKPLFSAIKAGHVLVAAASGIKYLLQLATVLSASILLLRNSTHMSHKKFALRASSGIMETCQRWPNAITALEGTEAFARQVYNFTPTSDAETTCQNRRLVQAFQPIGEPLREVYNISAVVNWFISEIECEVVVPHSIRKYDTDTPCSYDLGTSPCLYINGQWANTSESPCFTDGISFNTPCLDESQRSVQPLATYVADVSYYTCKNGTDEGQSSIFFSLAGNIRASTMAEPMIQSRLVQCKSKYLIQNATVTRNYAGKVLDVLPIQPQTTVSPGLIRDDDLGSNVIYAYLNAENTDFFDTSHAVFQVSQPFFFAPLTLNRSLFTHFYDDMSGFISAMQDTYTVGAAALVSTHYMIRHAASEPCTRSVQGTVSWLEHRLVVAALPTHIITSLLGAAIGLGGLMLFFVPEGVVSGKPDSLSFAAAVIRRSASLENLLRNTSLLSKTTFPTLLANYTYRSYAEVDGSIVIKVENITGVEKTGGSRPQPLGGEQWYQPLWFSTFGKILILSLPAALIVALEALLQLSRERPGICDIGDAETDRYAWLYVPTATLWLLRMFSAGLAFEVLLIEPFHLLARRKIQSGTYGMQTIMKNRMRTPAVVRLLSATRHYRIAIIAASLIGIAAPFLTIITAGLYTSSEVYNSTSTEIAAPKTWFNASAAASADRLSEPPLVAGLVAFSNMSFPENTFKTLAFPSLKIDSIATDARFSLRLPAYRARVRCYEVKDFNLTVEKGSTAKNHPDCSGCQSYSNVNLEFRFSTDDHFLRDWQDAWSGTSLNETKEIKVDSGTVGYVHLRQEPTFQAPFGEFYIVAMELAKGRVPRHANVQVCRAGHEVIDTDVVYQYPSMEVLSATVNEGTARWFANGTDLWPKYTDVTGEQAVNRSAGLDSLFNTMVYGRWPASFQDLLTNATLLSRTVEWFAQLEGAQIADKSYRADITDLKDQKPWHGFSQMQNADVLYERTLFIPSPTNGTMYARVDRLIQSPIATRILDGLLGLLLICALVIYWEVRYKGITPRQPGSLATTFSLLAGHHLEVPRGMESWDAKTMSKNQLWRNDELSMRYRDDSGGERHYGIDTDRTIAPELLQPRFRRICLNQY